MRINKSIFRKYDIRGIYQDTLTDDIAYAIGKAFATEVTNVIGNKLPIVVGMDGRLSSSSLKDALIGGITDAGVDALDIGLSPTPLLYHTTMIGDVLAGINITGSHNPPEYNGFKFVLNKKPFFGEDVIKLYDIIEQQKYVLADKKGKVIKKSVSQRYVDDIVEKSNITSVGEELKCVWDPGNGVVADILPSLVKNIPGKHAIINGEVDGTFPNHHPDPVVINNLQQIRDFVMSNNYDLGFAFDGDGDRLTAIDREGNIIFGEKLLLIFAYDLLKRVGGATIIVDVKTSSNITNLIKKWGGKPLMWKTGHSFIKNKMHLENALLAGEMSGHLFFKENYYGFDDAIFAALNLIRIVRTNLNIFKEVFAELPKTISTSEIRLKASDHEKFQIIENIKGYLQKQGMKFFALDGIRLEIKDAWWLIRASNTEDCIIIRVEAQNKDTLNENIEFINKIIKENSNIGEQIELVC